MFFLNITFWFSKGYIFKSSDFGYHITASALAHTSCMENHRFSHAFTKSWIFFQGSLAGCRNKTFLFRLTYPTNWALSADTWVTVLVACLWTWSLNAQPPYIIWLSHSHKLVSDTHNFNLVTKSHKLVPGGHKLNFKRPLSCSHKLISAGHELLSGGHKLLSGGHKLLFGGHKLVCSYNKILSCSHKLPSWFHNILYYYSS